MECHILFSGKNKKNISKYRLLKILPRVLSVKDFSIFSSGSHFVQPSGTILAILVTSHKKNISVKLF